MTATNGARSAFQIAYPNLAGHRAQQRQGDDRLPFYLAWLGLLLYLLISDDLLVLVGIPYNIPGGSFLIKLHPGTYLIALGFVLLLLQGDPRQHWPRLFAVAPAPLLFGGVVLSVAIYSLIRFGPSGSAFYIDTLLMPPLLATLLLQAPLELRRRAFRMVVVVLALNALLSIGEAATKINLIPSVPNLDDDFFRATALGGHPLKNSLTTATTLIACVILPRGVLMWLIPLLVLGILGFGERLPLGLSLLILGGLGGYYFVKELAARSIDPRLIFAFFSAFLMIGAGMVTLVVGFDFGHRIFQNLSWDNSAHSRILVFQAFNYLGVEDWLWGMGPDRISGVLERLISSTTVAGWENFWVLLFMQVGLAGFIPLTIALFGMIIGLTRRGPPALKWAAVIFLLLASANNSLATKNQGLAILVAVLIGGAAEAKLRKTLRP
ncbi:VpsF family polysaccharide biosynthesis protein [uncultured Thiodictyon sp.]|uniref:VpsF family polysaccharide biosynthesis protein n=1 Tax=uncultured Thiodictyon sp. TaxID=1846217 RepID=UPI0025DBA669|nr:VpsF family polysaccharide biosynthesis protein [uncultured Thiodictyon sp.]